MRVVGLSGTPLSNEIEEAVPLFNILHGKMVVARINVEHPDDVKTLKEDARAFPHVLHVYDHMQTASKRRAAYVDCLLSPFPRKEGTTLPYQTTHYNTHFVQDTQSHFNTHFHRNCRLLQYELFPYAMDERGAYRSPPQWLSRFHKTFVDTSLAGQYGRVALMDSALYPFVVRLLGKISYIMPPHDRRFYPQIHNQVVWLQLSDTHRAYYDKLSNLRSWTTGGPSLRGKARLERRQCQVHACAMNLHDESNCPFVSASGEYIPAMQHADVRAAKCAKRLVAYMLQQQGQAATNAAAAAASTSPPPIEVPKVAAIYQAIVDPLRRGTKAMIMSTNLGGFKKSITESDRRALLNDEQDAADAFRALENNLFHSEGLTGMTMFIAHLLAQDAPRWVRLHAVATKDGIDIPDLDQICNGDDGNGIVRGFICFEQDTGGGASADGPGGGATAAATTTEKKTRKTVKVKSALKRFSEETTNARKKMKTVRALWNQLSAAEKQPYLDEHKKAADAAETTNARAAKTSSRHPKDMSRGMKTLQALYNLPPMYANPKHRAAQLEARFPMATHRPLRDRLKRGYQERPDTFQFGNVGGRIAKILLLSAKRGESIEFKNVTQFHFIECLESPQKIEQAIGRAVRLHSHQISPGPHWTKDQDGELRKQVFQESSRAASGLAPCGSVSNRLDVYLYLMHHVERHLTTQKRALVTIDASAWKNVMNKSHAQTLVHTLMKYAAMDCDANGVVNQLSEGQTRCFAYPFAAAALRDDSASTAALNRPLFHPDVNDRYNAQGMKVLPPHIFAPLMRRNRRRRTARKTEVAADETTTEAASDETTTDETIAPETETTSSAPAPPPITTADSDVPEIVQHINDMLQHINDMLRTRKKHTMVEVQGNARVHVQASYRNRVLTRVKFTAWCASEAQRTEVEDVVAQVRRQQVLQPPRSVLVFVDTPNAVVA